MWCSHLFAIFFQDCTDGGASVAVESEPSSYSASVLAKKAKQGKLMLNEADSLPEAIKHIATINNKKPATIIITGSLFLIADFLKL